MTRPRFASDTSVPVSRTRDELERLVQINGATQFVYAGQDGSAMIGFRIRDVVVRIILPLPSREAEIAREKKEHPYRKIAEAPIAARVAQLERQYWRVLLLVVKAKFEAVAAGVSTIEKEFLADTVAPDGRTVYEHVAGQLRTGAPLMLPAPGEASR